MPGKPPGRLSPNGSPRASRKTSRGQVRGRSSLVHRVPQGIACLEGRHLRDGDDDALPRAGVSPPPLRPAPRRELSEPGRVTGSPFAIAPQMASKSAFTACSWPTTGSRGLPPEARYPISSIPVPFRTEPYAQGVRRDGILPPHYSPGKRSGESGKRVAGGVGAGAVRPGDARNFPARRGERGA